MIRVIRAHVSRHRYAPTTLVLTVAVLFAIFAAPAELSAQEKAPRAKDSRLLSAGDFRGARLRGFNLGPDKLDPQDLADLAATGANVARLMLPVVRCATCERYALVFGFDYIDMVIREAAAKGFYVIPTLEVVPPSPLSEYWGDKGLRDSLASIWREIARRYRDSPAVAAYDLINEPNPPARSGPDKVTEWRALASMLAKEIRSVDSRHAIIVALPWVFWASADLMEPIAFANVVYTFHMYEPMPVTHQGLYEYAPGQPYPTGEVNAARLWKDYLAVVARFAKRHDVAIFVGEFSCVRWAPNGAADRYVADMIAAFESQGWSWAYHSFRNYPGWSADIEPGPKELVMRRGQQRAFTPATATWQTLIAGFRRNALP